MRFPWFWKYFPTAKIGNLKWGWGGVVWRDTDNVYKLKLFRVGCSCSFLLCTHDLQNSPDCSIYHMYVFHQTCVCFSPPNVSNGRNLGQFMSEQMLFPDVGKDSRVQFDNTSLHPQMTTCVTCEHRTRVLDMAIRSNIQITFTFPSQM